MFSTCTVEITQYALNQRSPARSGKVKGVLLVSIALGYELLGFQPVPTVQFE